MNNVVDLWGKPVEPGENIETPQAAPDLAYTLSQMEAGLAHLCFLARHKPELFRDVQVSVASYQYNAAGLLGLVRRHIDYIDRQIAVPDNSAAENAARQQALALAQQQAAPARALSTPAISAAPNDGARRRLFSIAGKILAALKGERL